MRLRLFSLPKEAVFTAKEFEAYWLYITNVYSRYKTLNPRIEDGCPSSYWWA